MSIVLAQIKKDIHSNRDFMIAWGAFLAINLFLLPLLLLFSKLVHGKNTIDFHSFGGSALGILFSLLLMYDLLFGLILFLTVPLLPIGIIQQDMLVGTTAFWRTRPIPREKLLAAKAILLGAVLLPFLLLIIVTNAHYGGGHLWITVTAWITAFAAIASITSGIKQFIKYSFALYIFVKFLIISILGNLWTQFGGDRSSLHQWLSPRDIESLSLHLNTTDFIHLFYFTGFSIVLIHQYLTLERKRSRAILIMVVAAACLIKLVLAYHGIL